MKGLRVVVFPNLKFKADEVYGDGVLPGIVLCHAGEEGLGEVEAREPEDSRGATGDPTLPNPNIQTVQSTPQWTKTVTFWTLYNNNKYTHT